MVKWTKRKSLNFKIYRRQIWNNTHKEDVFHVVANDWLFISQRELFELGRIYGTLLSKEQATLGKNQTATQDHNW